PEAWLFGRFGVARQRDWPVAPYTLLADGGAPERHHWMRADPVHLQVGRNSLGLADSASFDVSRAESEALVEALTRHFVPTIRLPGASRLLLESRSGRCRGTPAPFSPPWKTRALRWSC